MRARLAVEERGDGPPLVLLHGIATDRRIWSQVAPALARRWRVITPDLPGFGRSAPAGEDFDLERVADRIARSLAARGIPGPFDLVGHSLGGAVAVTLATRPKLVRRLVLVAPAGLRPLPAGVGNLLAAGADAALAVRRAAAPLTELAWGRRLLFALIAADGADMPPPLARELIEASDGAARTSAALAAITSADLRPALRAVRTPIGVVWGRADRTVPIRDLDAILAERPDAEVIRLAGAGHVPMIERPAAFAESVEQLLERLDR